MYDLEMGLSDTIVCVERSAVDTCKTCVFYCFDCVRYMCDADDRKDGIDVIYKLLKRGN